MEKGWIFLQAPRYKPLCHDQRVRFEIDEVAWQRDVMETHEATTRSPMKLTPARHADAAL